MNLEKLFNESACPVEHKLANFPKYVRRQEIARFLCRYEIFKRQLNVKGSIVECGVHHGGGVMTWAHFSATLEPYNYHRRVVGFDTFQGFPGIASQDGHGIAARAGAFAEGYDIHAELTRAVGEFDENRFLNQKRKVELIKGDANQTIPQYLADNPHLVVSLLYLDFDIYRPTVTALRILLPRMPKGGIVAFDEVNNEDWPGETLAMMEELQLRSQRLECLPFEPNISFIQLD